ncbi:MAG: hypothetical protein BZY73_04700 [SAR202 cluster bacterium Casp-Chloro-G3]|nr:MAG: hypothetical protein BZY73_04700 [SAR202 cluster bacterium Casp-Chloro-G3]
MWERTEERGITLIPTFSHQGGLASKLPVAPKFEHLPQNSSEVKAMIDCASTFLAEIFFMVISFLFIGLTAQAWFEESRMRRRLNQLQAKLEQSPNENPFL